MSEALSTLAELARHENRVRNSRFVAQAAPIADEDEAMAFLKSVSEYSANHNCWAWRLGQNYRFNDDGEPGSSAGKPILMAIDGESLDRVMVVVTRWFGGIKLGIGGLARAYGGTATECLRSARRVAIVDMAAVEFCLSYSEMVLFRARTRDWHKEVIREDFGAHGVQMTLNVACERLEELEALLADLSRGRCSLAYL